MESVRRTSLAPGKLEDKSEFKLFAYLRSRESEIILVAKGPQGETETEKLIIYAPEAQEYRISSPWGRMVVSIGLATFDYAQSSYAFSSKTGIVKLLYASPEVISNVTLLAHLRSTVLTLSSRPEGLGLSF